nr:hypothetical protein [uncultured Bacteroides sp.]
MKKIFVPMALVALLSITSCSETFEPSVDFGDRTYVNDYSKLVETLKETLNNQTATLAEKLNALNTTMTNGFANVKLSIDAQTGEIKTGFTNVDSKLGTINTNILNGFTAVSGSINTQTNTLKISIDKVAENVDKNNTAIVNLSAQMASSLEALRAEVEKQGGKIVTAIDNQGNVIVTAIDKNSQVISTQYAGVAAAIANQTTTVKDAIAANAAQIAKAITDGDQATVNALTAQNALLGKLINYSDGLTFNGTPDYSGKYTSINVTPELWKAAKSDSEIMNYLTNQMQSHGTPAPTPTQYCSSYRNLDESQIHDHSVWTKISDSNETVELSGYTSQDGVTLCTLTRVYMYTTYRLTISSSCAFPYIYYVKVTDAASTDRVLYNGGGITSFDVVFVNYNNGYYCPNPTAKVYTTYSY